MSNSSKWIAPVSIGIVSLLALAALRNNQQAAVRKAEEIDRSIAHVSEATFEADVMQADGPVLVDFYADWCGPCKRQAEVLRTVQPVLQTGKIVKVDIDANPGLARAYGVSSIPTLILFRDGELVEKRVGVTPSGEIQSLLQ